ncbi:MAG TPA: hypothetical protein VL401_00825 [Alphaproteobacteria bacterium]|jgi:hypothetical protein|nr:hypothetical protein [Alphaproteobacteria bacterium]
MRKEETICISQKRRNKMKIRHWILIGVVVAALALVVVISFSWNKDTVMTNLASQGIVQKTPAAFPSETLVPDATSIPEPTATLAPSTEVPSTAMPEVANVQECSLTDGTAQLQLSKDDEGWFIGSKDLKPVKGYDGSQPGHDASHLEGCPVIIEYQASGVQYVVVENPGFDKYTIPEKNGASAWAIPADWNACDLSTPKPAVCLELAAESNANQKPDVPETIVQADGKITTYEVGHFYGNYYAGCVDLKEPGPINVAGKIEGNGFKANIGIEGCKMYTKIDNKDWSIWNGAQDIFYHTIEAWLFPQFWTETQIDAWVSTH